MSHLANTFSIYELKHISSAKIEQKKNGRNKVIHIRTYVYNSWR